MEVSHITHFEPTAIKCDHRTIISVAALLEHFHRKKSYYTFRLINVLYFQSFNLENLDLYLEAIEETASLTGTCTEQ